MRIAAIPSNEQARLQALEEHAILDTPPEEDFDSLTRLAAHIIDVPMALVSIVAADRQWFKSRVGIEGTETSRDLAFCSHVVESERTMIVPDARLDPRFSDNPMVCGNPHVCFYAGVPLTTEEGLVLGTLCVVDDKPRTLSKEHLEMLQLLARQAAAQLQIRRKDRHLALERKRLQESESRLLSLFEAMTEGVVVMERPGEFTQMNPAAKRILGDMQSSAQTSSELRVLDAHGKDFPPEAWPIHRAFHDRATSSSVLMQLVRGGHVTWLSVNAAPLDGEKPAAIATFNDITEREAVQAALRRSLGEKDTLLQEVHHRVKNNLQVVASLLSLQGRGLTDPTAREMFNATRHRVSAIALLHEGLYRSSDLGSIELEAYLKGLVRELVRASADPNRPPAIVCSAPGVHTDMDTAVPLGLIINELVANALKHAFKNRAPGLVAVRLSAKDGHAELEVKDDGAGLPPDFAPGRAEGLGLRLVQNLAHQLDGLLTYTSEQGTTWHVRFPSRGKLRVID